MPDLGGPPSPFFQGGRTCLAPDKIQVLVGGEGVRLAPSDGDVDDWAFT